LQYLSEKELTLNCATFSFVSMSKVNNLSALATCARLVALSVIICSAVSGQGQGLSITNYQVVSQQTLQRTLNVTYRADIVNTGAALQAVTATVASLNTSVVQVAAGQDALQFPSVPANSQVTSSNTFTIQVDTLPVDFSQLQWTFNTAAILLPSNVTVTPGDTVEFPVALGAAAPAGGVFITLASSNPSIASVSPSTFFVSQGTTVAQRVTTIVNGNTTGSVTITASAPGYATGSGQVQVTSGGTTATTMSFWPGSLTVSQAATQDLTLNLSVPAPAGLVVSLSSSAPTVATAPATVSIATGATGVSVPVMGVSAGLATITATAPNIASATASINVPQTATTGIVLPANVTVAPFDTVNFPVSLGTVAPSGGVFITLASSNSSIASVSPSTFFVPEGATTARAATTVTGYNAGSATITASAPGFGMASVQVQVTGGISVGTTLSFSPGSLTINGTATQDLTLNLSGPAPSPLTVSLSSTDPTVAAVPATVSFGTGATSVPVPVTGVAGGSVTITASAPGIASATATVAITQAAAGGILIPPSVTVMPGGIVSFPVTLGTAAPAGGVYITLASSDPTVATVSPSSFTIPQGATSASRAPTTVSGVNTGSASITASAFGYPTASAQVQVTAGVPATPTMSFSPSSLTINGTATQNLTLNLSVFAPAFLTVNLTSSNPTVATVPATVNFATGASSASVPVTGVSAGSVTITASLTSGLGATASVTVAQASAPGIVAPAGITVGLNQSATLQVALPTPAPTGGITVSLASSDTSIATVTPTVFIAARNTAPATQLQVSGLQLGTASITASAPGFTPGITQVQVTAGGGSSFFSPVSGLTVNAGSTQSLTLNLSSAPAGGLVVSLSSSDPTVATVPATVTSTAGSASMSVPVTGVAAGSVTITARAPGFGTATATVTVASTNGISINWYGACWANLTINGFTGNFQAIDFSLTTPAPVVLNGSLFFTPNCDPAGGVDNLNDTGATTGSTHMIQGFIHYPNVIPSSAIYWIGGATTDGTKCPAGSLCSGCVSYTQATPSCSILP
jgi:trimeric autotransporter adhesin